MSKNTKTCWNCGFLKGSGNCAQCSKTAKAKTWAQGQKGAKR